MIRRLVDFALKERFLMAGLGILLLLWGIYSFRALPVEAYPDVANTYVQVITQWPGRAAEEVEQQVSIPIETQVNGVQNLAHLRSTSLAGLSVVNLVFDDDADNFRVRQQVLEKLAQLTLPNNLQPQLGPDYSPVGQIYFYSLASSDPRYDVMELKAIEDWELEKRFKSVANVVDVSSFGGATREYQVRIDPDKLISYGLTLAQVEQALAANNVNAGGNFVEHGQQLFNVRAVGLMKNTADIGQTVVKSQNGTPVRIRDIAEVAQGPRIRLGQVGKAMRQANGKVTDDDDVVEGIVLLRKGAEFDSTINAIHEKVDDLNRHFLPKGVSIVPHLDRGDLVGLTTETVMHNLTEGILLVVAILFLFLGNVRSALIVAMTIPFSLMFASILLDLRHIPANLLSLGALDFGMVVDGAVVMVENILRHVSREDEQQFTITERIAHAAHEVQRPVFYAIGIIITAYLPIFTLEHVEGKLFRPMAWTVAFALLGALLFSMLLAPVLASFLFRKAVKEFHNPVLDWIERMYRWQVRWCIEHRWITLLCALGALGFSLFLAFTGRIGSEFLPHLDEGAIWARGTLGSSIGPTEATRITKEARRIFASFPEVKQVVSQVGRPDDGTDSTGFFNSEYFVDLYPRSQWRSRFHDDKEALIEEMNTAVSRIPGAIWNFSQPIADNMEEAVSGVKGQLAVKLYGTDLKQLEATADQIKDVMGKIDGIADLGVFRVVGQPNVNYEIDRERAARFGLNVADIQDVIETAVGGKPVSQILDGERRYDLVPRLQQRYRETPEEIASIRISAPSGERVSLAQVCNVKTEDGASMIYREAGSRYIAIKYSVRGRDLGSAVEESIRNVGKSVKLPTGYRLEWAGEYESQKRSQARLAVIVPVTILGIFIILYAVFHSLKWSGLIMANIVLAPIGGLFALYFTGTHFSVSSGVGFLALFGVSVQIGLIMVEYINQLRSRGEPIETAAIDGAVRRLRPIMMTMLVATLGLMPAATSHGIGSDSQRPFAIVIVGGLIATLFMSVLLLPTLYVWIASDSDALEGESNGTTD